MDPNSVLKNMESAPQERAFLKSVAEEEADFETRIMKAYNNPHTLKYITAVNMANQLRQKGLTSGKLTNRGEKGAADLCGPDIVDVAVVVGVLKKMEELEKNNITE
jgi:hypothetical protein